MREPLRIPAAVRAKALAYGADDWLAGLPDLIRDLERQWQVTVDVNDPRAEATEAWVAHASGPGADWAAVKLIVPRPGDHARHEIAALRAGRGAGLVQLYAADEARGAMLLERLGPCLAGFGFPLAHRLKIFLSLSRDVWRPAPGCGLPTGADRARSLIDVISRRWDELGRPCSEAAVAYAVQCAERRADAYDEQRAVLVHGDIHQWNTLRVGDDPRSGYRLVDPDGVLAERECDLGVLMREDPAELIAGDPWERARFLAAVTGTDAIAIWEWGAADRVATGFTLLGVGLHEQGTQMLAAAEAVIPRPGRAG